MTLTDAAPEHPPTPPRDAARRTVLAPLQTPAARRVIDVAAPLGVVALAAVLRLTNLGNPHELVFDETYYVKDAFSLWQLGYEGQWPDDANAAFVEGESTLGSAASFVVHPPLGKWILGIGMGLGGIEDPVAWRWPAAVVGILVVVLTLLVARGLTRSWAWGSLAGLLLAIDGQAIVMSRTVLLDQTLALLVLAGAGALLLDRLGAPARIARWRHTHPGSWLGPALWSRPWIVAAGVALGAACAVKWSGLYFVAAFGLWSVALDALDRRRAGIRGWHLGTLVTQAPTSLVLLMVPAIAVYLVSWTGWFGGGYSSDWAEQHPDELLTGALAWVPPGLQSLWHYHEQIWTFHVGLTSDHPFESPAWQWLPLLRPTAFLLHLDGDMMTFITALANPVVWYPAVAGLLVLLYRVGARLDRTAAFLVVAVAAGYVPWLAFPDRTIFAFYTIVFEPFLVIGLAYLLWRLVHGRVRPITARVGRILVTALVVLAIAAAVFFAPLWYGVWTPENALRLRYWLPGWR